MSARGRTVTASAMLEQKRSDAADIDGERATLDLLASGKLEIEGRLVDASNATLYCTIKTAGREVQDREEPARRGQVACVYKPIAGERPLWDFPMGTLAGREVAAYVVSRAAGWTWSRRRSCGTGLSGPACASCGSTTTPTWT